MKLSLEDIKRVTVGALRVYEESDGVHFYRSTQKQMDFWQSRSDFLGGGARCTTGVRLDLETDSKMLTFTVSAGKYEVLVNGVLRKAVVAADGETFSVPLCDALGGALDSKRVTLALPSHGAGGVLKSVELDDGARFERHEFDRKLLFFGDSITQGWDSEMNVLSYAYQTSLQLNADSIIQGIGGSYFHEDSFDEFDFDPDTVIVAYGTNDYNYYKTLDEIRAHAAAFMGKVAARYKNKRLVCISPTWRMDALTKPMPVGSFDGVRRAIAAEAEKLGFMHVDGLTLVPTELKFYLDDGLHPNALGFSMYASNLIKQLS